MPSKKLSELVTAFEANEFASEEERDAVERLRSLLDAQGDGTLLSDTTETSETSEDSEDSEDSESTESTESTESSEATVFPVSTYGTD